MAPRKTDPELPREKPIPKKPGPGQDRKRDLEDRKHHPSKTEKIRSVHKPQKKPPLPPKHSTHSHPHGEAIGPHSNKPSPIKPAKKITLTGSKNQ